MQGIGYSDHRYAFDVGEFWQVALGAARHVAPDCRGDLDDPVYADLWHAA